MGPLTRPCVPAVSLENVLLDVKELGRGMELLRRECGLHENSVLRAFLAGSEGKLERLQKDARTAEVRAAEWLCLTRPLHTPCHARLALHAPRALLVMHTLLGMLVVRTFACSSCTPVLLCMLLVACLALHGPRAHLRCFARPSCTPCLTPPLAPGAAGRAAHR